MDDQFNTNVELPYTHSQSLPPLESVLFFWCVKCPGHGKCRCDSEGGICKTRVDVHFNRFVALPGNSSDEVTVPIHHVQDGALLSLAEVV